MTTFLMAIYKMITNCIVDFVSDTDIGNKCFSLFTGSAFAIVANSRFLDGVMWVATVFFGSIIGYIAKKLVDYLWKKVILYKASNKEISKTSDKEES